MLVISMEKETKNYGRAYAFFDCKYSKAEIEDEIPKACIHAQTPSELELVLTEDPQAIRDNRELTEALDVARRVQMKADGVSAEDIESMPLSYRYVLEARYPDKTNNEAATKLVNIMNLLYTSSPLWERKEESFARIIYQQGDKYISAER